MAEGFALRLQAYAQAWGNVAAAGIAEHWLPANFRYYKAEEFREVNTSWADTLAYWQGNEQMHQKVSLSFAKVTDLGVPGPLRLVWADMDWAITFADDARDAQGTLLRHAGKSMAGWCHVLSAWERDGNEDWRLTGWLEAPDAPPVYLTDLYYKMGRA